jgi:hypothetical protein
MGTEQDQNPQVTCGFNLDCVSDLERLLESQECALGKSSREVADTLSALSELYWHSEECWAQAESCLLRALDIKTELYGITHQEIIYILDKLADRYTQQGRFAEASRLERWRRQAYHKMTEGTDNARSSIVDGRTAAKTTPITSTGKTNNVTQQVPQSSSPPGSRHETKQATASTAPALASTEDPASASHGAATPFPPPSDLDATHIDLAVSPGGNSMQGAIVVPTYVAVSQKTSGEHKNLRQSDSYEHIRLPAYKSSSRAPASALIVGPAKEKFELKGDALFIGSAAMNDICIRNDGQTEKYQALVKREGNDWFVVNRASTNYTLLNGFPIGKQTRIGPGDILTCGNTTIQVM